MPTGIASVRIGVIVYRTTRLWGNVVEVMWEMVFACRLLNSNIVEEILLYSLLHLSTETLSRSLNLLAMLN